MHPNQTFEGIKDRRRFAVQWKEVFVMPPRKPNEANYYIDAGVDQLTKKETIYSLDGGLNEEILTTGNLEVLRGFLRNNVTVLSKEEREYLNLRIKAQEAFEREKAKQTGKLVAGEEKDYPKINQEGDYMNLDLRYPGKQTSYNGCWSCALSLMLKSRGVNLTQEQIRSWRPDYKANNGKSLASVQSMYERNADTPMAMENNADMVTDLLPNTSMKTMFFNRIDPDAFVFKNEKDEQIHATSEQKKIIADEIKAKTAQMLNEKICDAVLTHHSPVALTVVNHTITVTGIDPKTGMLLVQDSLLDPTDSVVSIDSVVSKCIEDEITVDLFGNKHYSMASGLAVTWLEDINVPKYELHKENHMQTDFGIVADCVTVDDEGKVAVQIPPDQEIFSDMERDIDGVVKSKHVSVNVMLDSTDLTRKLGGKVPYAYGSPIQLTNTTSFLPSKLHFKEDVRERAEYISGAKKQADEIDKIISPDEKNDKLVQKKASDNSFKECFNKLDEILGIVKNGSKKTSALNELKKLPDILTAKMKDGRTFYQNLASVLPDNDKEKLYKNMYELNEHYGLGVNMGAALGMNGLNPHPADMEHSFYQNHKFDELKAVLTNDKSKQEKEADIYKVVNEIVAEEQLWQMGYGQTHLSTKGESEGNLSEERKQKNKRVLDNISNNGGIIELVKDAKNCGDIFARVMTQSVVLGEDYCNTFSFSGNEEFINDFPLDPSLAPKPIKGIIRTAGYDPMAKMYAPKNMVNSVSEYDYKAESDLISIGDDDGFTNEGSTPTGDEFGTEDTEFSLFGDDNIKSDTVNNTPVSGTASNEQKNVIETAANDDSSAYYVVDSVSLKAQLEDLKKKLEAKHTIGFIGGGASDEMKKLRTSVQNMLNYINEKQSKGINNDRLKELVNEMKTDANTYIKAKQNESLRYSNDGKIRTPISGMGKTRYMAAEDICNLNLEQFTSRHTIIENEQNMIRQLKETVSQFPLNADIEDLKPQLAELLATVVVKPSIFPSDREPNYSEFFDQEPYKGVRKDAALANEITTAKNNTNFKELMRQVKTPQDVLKLCDAALKEKPVEASAAVLTEVTKAIERHNVSLDKNTVKNQTEPSKNNVSPKKKIDDKIRARIMDKWGVDSTVDTLKKKRSKNM